MENAQCLKLRNSTLSNLAALVLDQNYAETVGVKKLLKTVPVRNPNNHDFVRTNPELRLSPAALTQG
jgi:hypothetical protein